MSEEIFTVGHSNHPAELFIGLLERHGVTAVADVRSTPYSRRNPQFNRDELRDALKARGIQYVFLGTELGARSEDESCYVDDKVSYAALARLMKRLKLNTDDMFGSLASMAEPAYDAQAERIAYDRKPKRRPG